MAVRRGRSLWQSSADLGATLRAPGCPTAAGSAPLGQQRPIPPGSRPTFPRCGPQALGSLAPPEGPRGSCTVIRVVFSPFLSCRWVPDGVLAGSMIRYKAPKAGSLQGRRRGPHGGRDPAGRPPRSAQPVSSVALTGIFRISICCPHVHLVVVPLTAHLPLVQEEGDRGGRRQACGAGRREALCPRFTGCHQNAPRARGPCTPRSSTRVRRALRAGHHGVTLAVVFAMLMGVQGHPLF